MVDLKEVEKELIFWISDWIKKHIEKHYAMIGSGSLKHMDKINEKFVPKLLAELDMDIQHIIKKVIEKHESK